MPRWLDAHTHLDSEELFAEKETLLDRALHSGVQRILLVNSNATEASFQRTLECLRLEHSIERFATFGVHPHEASSYNAELEQRISNLVSESKVIAVGEIGLDFYYNYSPQDVQVTALQRQLVLATQKQVPVVIHCRDAYPRLAEILRNIATKWRGMVHCFTGTLDEMRPLLDLGFYISFSGITTFRKAVELQECAKTVPLDRILIETDAPYLAPVPHRGKRNEPSYVIETGKFIASLRGITEDELSRALFHNFDQLFQPHNRRAA